MITLNKFGSAILQYENEWDKYCKDNDIETPFQKRQRIFQECLRPSVIKTGNGESLCARVFDYSAEQRERMPSETEMDLYKKMKNLFIGRRIFADLGYDYFEKYANINFPELLTLGEFKPCEPITLIIY